MFSHLFALLARFFLKSTGNCSIRSHILIEKRCTYRSMPAPLLSFSKFALNSSRGVLPNNFCSYFLQFYASSRSSWKMLWPQLLPKKSDLSSRSAWSRLPSLTTLEFLNTHTSKVIHLCIPLILQQHLKSYGFHLKLGQWTWIYLVKPRQILSLTPSAK